MSQNKGPGIWLGTSCSSHMRCSSDAACLNDHFYSALLQDCWLRHLVSWGAGTRLRPVSNPQVHKRCQYGRSQQSKAISTRHTAWYEVFRNTMAPRTLDTTDAHVRARMRREH